MRGSKVLTTAILVLMLAAVMGLRNAEAQTPLACDAIPFTDGWISMTVGSTATLEGSMELAQDNDLIYNAGLLGTVENFNGNVIAGLDWLYDDRQPNLETNMVGTQLVSWWTRKDGRNTIIQATNTNPDTDICDQVNGIQDGAVNVHVQILGEDCGELRNYCDTFTPLDTVVYDLSNLVSNVGQVISTGNLAEREGIIVITPVETCNIAAPPTFDAISWNFMQGNVRIINEIEDWEYGANVRARTAYPAENGGGVCGGNIPVIDFYTELNTEPATALFKDFNSIGTNPGADLVLISFGDYGLRDDFGTEGVYQAGPAPVSTFGPFAIFDDAENPESCPPVQGCFVRIGIDEGIPSTDDVTPTPPTPTCLIDPETGFPVDCSDPLCKPLDGCENPNFPPDGSLCTDGIDNDGVDGVDCADFGCDGFIADSETGAQCESSGETSCDDLFDNDNNGFVDCGLLGGDPDPNCVAIGACGDDDDDDSGGGCTLTAGPVSGGTAGANILLALLPLAGVFAVRRIARRRRK